MATPTRPMIRPKALRESVTVAAWLATAGTFGAGDCDVLVGLAAMGAPADSVGVVAGFDDPPVDGITTTDVLGDGVAVTVGVAIALGGFVAALFATADGDGECVFVGVGDALVAGLGLFVGVGETATGVEQPSMG